MTFKRLEKCGICQASSQAAKPVGNVSDMLPHAWHTLGTDLFYWNKIDYLVIGDYFSKYLIVRRLPNSSTCVVIKELGLVFTELGRPFILRSDNGPCYSSREFHNFLGFYQVDHITSSPHYPQSNGFTEALVGITKKMMEKSVMLHQIHQRCTSRSLHPFREVNGLQWMFCVLCVQDMQWKVLGLLVLVFRVFSSTDL